MGIFHSNTSNKVHPAIPSTPTTFTIGPDREYLSDGRIIVYRPIPPGGPPHSCVVIYPDGSYAIGTIRGSTKQLHGYCEYRDIANRLIYTGYMNDSAYNGWGSIWDETGNWPEYTTYWCMSRPGNRILHTTPDKMRWELTLDWEEDEDTKVIKTISTTIKQLFDKIKHDYKAHKEGSTEPYYQQMITLYTRIRSDPSHTPPSPHIGPKAVSAFKERTTTPIFLAVSPPTSPQVRLEAAKAERSIENPLRFRIPPNTLN